MANSPVDYNKVAPLTVSWHTGNQDETSLIKDQGTKISANNNPSVNNQVSLGGAVNAVTITSSDTQHYETPGASAAIGDPDYVDCCGVEVLTVSSPSTVYNKIPLATSDGTYETLVIINGQETSYETPVTTTTTDTDDHSS